MTYALNVSEQEKIMLDEYAKASGKTVSEFIHEAVLEKLEDAYDIVLFQKALKEHLQHPDDGYTLEEVGKHLGLEE